MEPLVVIAKIGNSADAGQIRHNRMKLAMAVGDKRHYVVDTAVPRHGLVSRLRGLGGP